MRLTASKAAVPIMEASANTPFKLPIWSPWTIQVKDHKSQVICHSEGPTLKRLSIQALVKHLKAVNRILCLPEILAENMLPPTLFEDMARELFAMKQWSTLRSVISHWPHEVLHLSDIISGTCTCTSCWLNYLETDDFEDPEKEGGDTERQLFRKAFKHILDGYFSVVKSTLENNERKSPLRILDLTLDPSKEIRGFMWEEEFRRLGRRLTKTLDVCLLAGLHKKAKLLRQLKSKPTQKPTSNESNNWNTNRPHEEMHATENQTNVCENVADFEISTWDANCYMPTHTNGVQQEPDIGIWDGNALDLSHLTEIPAFTVNIDASFTERSCDILTWIQQRYDDFLPCTSPVSISIRFLEMSLHEERKFEALMERVPDNVHGLQLDEICERRSASTLACHLPHFKELRFLDLGSCAFDLANHPSAVESLAYAFTQLPHLERLSLACNCLTGRLSELLDSIQRGLVLLDLSSCSLNDEDLEYLGESKHLDSLVSLSLARNELNLHWERIQQMICGLEDTKSNLRILDLSSNDFVESQLTNLSQSALGPLKSLALFDLSWHELPLSTLIEIIELFASRTNLRTFCVSTPVDMADHGYGQPEDWQSFVDYMTRLTAGHRGEHQHPLTLHWCLM